MEMMHQRRGWGGLALSLAVAVAIGFPVCCRADALDQALRNKAGDLMKQLRQRGYNNVGVLRFQVQVGAQKPTFTAGLLNSAMATRLENALIIADNERAPIGITRDAGATAAKEDRHSTYLTAAGRRQLFDYTYPLAWGNQQVKVDAFLTGMVQVSADMRQSTVVIEAFDRAHPEQLDSIMHFPVRNDLGVLSDLGARYSVVRRDLRLGASDNSEPETAPARPHKPREKPTDIVAVAEKDDLAALDLIDFQVYYDNKPVARHTTKNGRTEIAPPTAGTSNIRFDILRKTDKPVAVVVLVNGVNTADSTEQGKEPSRYSKWILKTRGPYSIPGFWSHDGKTVQQFKVISGTDLASRSDLDPDKLGQIELFVFPMGVSRPVLAQAERPTVNLKERTQTLRADLSLHDVKVAIGAAPLIRSRQVTIVPGAAKAQPLQEENVATLGEPVYLIIHYEER